MDIVQKPIEIKRESQTITIQSASLEENKLFYYPIVRIEPLSIAITKASKQKEKSTVLPQIVPIVIPQNQQKYYHVHSYEPILNNGFNDDSEDEMDYSWQRKKCEKKTDELIDISQEEKQLFFLWNEFIEFKQITFKEFPNLCEDFVKHKGKSIIENGLQHQLALHLFNLCDLDLINSQTIVQCNLLLEKIKHKST